MILLGLATANCATPARHAPATSPTRSPSPIRSSKAPESWSPSSATGGAVFPLTGLPAANGNALRPSLAIKIDNVAGSFPQAGLNAADIVVDTPVEGGLTRLFAVFQSQDAALVGPIRSARPVDGDLLRLLGGGYFAYSGANAQEIAPVKANSTAFLMSFDADNSLFEKLPGRSIPHEVFDSTTRLYAYAEHADPKMPPPHPIFQYDPTPASGPTTAGVVVHFPSATAGWQWNGRRYLRTQDGRPDLLTDGSQVSADNIVIMRVALKDRGIRDVTGAVEPWPQVIGSGECWVLRDGVRVPGTWSRTSLTAPMVLRDGAGQVITLRPGRTWVELAPLSAAVNFS
ncbi:MAG: DUF3048 domain-containing protein [Acidothermus sp.]|nr:DUF3048 domain-containing protein [Acidothermus sp.]